MIAYYLGILSGLPLIGLPLGIAAFILGIMGLNDRKRNPAIKGSIHAGIGIGCGLIFTLLWGGIIILGIVVFISEAANRWPEQSKTIVLNRFDNTQQKPSD